MARPPPSGLVLLSDLCQLKAGDKVRFLGCVEEYQTPSGTLVLKHNYPPSSASSTITHVNIDHVLETVKSTDIQVGSWVNIIGYVTAGEKIAKQPTARQSLKAKDPPRQPHVQAIVLWSAGSVNLDAYEKAVEQRKLLDSTSG